MVVLYLSVIVKSALLMQCSCLALSCCQTITSATVVRRCTSCRWQWTRLDVHALSRDWRHTSRSNAFCLTNQFCVTVTPCETMSCNSSYWLDVIRDPLNQSLVSFTLVCAYVSSFYVSLFKFLRCSWLQLYLVLLISANGEGCVQRLAGKIMCRAEH